MKYLILFIGFAAIVLVIVAVSYTAGRNRASDYDKIKKQEYKDMSSNLSELHKKFNKSEVRVSLYEDTLTAISQGKSGAPEIAAAAALNTAKGIK